MSDFTQLDSNYQDRKKKNEPLLRLYSTLVRQSSDPKLT